MAKIDVNKAIEHLRAKWSQRPCPMCGIAQWSVQESTYQLLEFNQGVGLSIGGPLIPVLPVTCNNCGNTILVNAIKAGLVRSISGEKP